MIKLINWLTDEDKDSKVRLLWLTKTFTNSDFEFALDKLLFNYLEFCRDCSIHINDKSLDVYCEYQLKRFMIDNKIQFRPDDPINNLGYIDYENLYTLDNILPTLTSLLFEQYTQYKEKKRGESFKFDCKQRLAELRKEKTLNLSQNTLTQTNIDFTDKVLETLSLNAYQIKSKYSDEVLNSFSLITGEPEIDEDTTTLRHLYNTGVKYIDGSAGGVFEDMLYTLTGISKGGKTRFALKHFAYPALLSGYDVAFFELELSVKQIYNMLYSIHLVTLSGGETYISDSSIGKGNGKEMVEVARRDLNGKDYGRLNVFTNLLLEDIENQFALLSLNPKCKMVVIDLMGKIETKMPEYRYKNRYEVISEAYILIKRMARKYHLAVLAVNQLTSEGAQAILNGKPFVQSYTEGGQATQRNTDYDLILGMTTEQKRADIRTLENYLSRLGKQADGICKLKVNLGTSTFTEVPNE